MQALEAPRQGSKVLPEIARSLLPWLAERLGTELIRLDWLVKLSTFIADPLQMGHRKAPYKPDNELYTAGKGGLK